MKIIKILQKIRLPFFTRIFLFIISIILAITVITMISSQYYIDSMENKIKDRYSISLTNLETILDNLLSNTFDTALKLTWNEKFKKIRNSKDIKMDFINGHGIIKTDPFIHDVFYINYKENYVVTRNSVMKTDDFFNYHYPEIKCYNIPIFVHNIFFPQIPRIIPTEFKINDLSYATVMPYLIFDQNPDNRILVNIDLQKITYIMKKYKITDRSNIMIINEYGDIITNTDYSFYPNRSLTYNRNFKYTLPEDSPFNPISKNFSKKITDQNIKNCIKKEKIITSDYFKEKRMIISKVSKLSSRRKIFYVATIPYRDIYPETFQIPFSLISFLIGLVCLFFSLILAFLISKNLYNPVKKILNLFKVKSYKNIKDEFLLITENIKNILNTNDQLHQKLNNALPIVLENYFIKFLNENLNLNEREFNDFIEKYNIRFDGNFFLLAIARVFFDTDFYEVFNHEKQQEIINDIFKLISNTFLMEFNCYILKISKNEFCIIINLNDINFKENIIKKLEEVSNIFTSEKNYLKILSGLGGIHEGLNGLKVSYEEAFDALSSISFYKDQKVKTYDHINFTNEQYDFSIKDENILINLINCNFEEKAIDFLKEIIEKNTKKNITTVFEKALYIRIYHACSNLVLLKNTTLRELMGNDYIDISKKYQQLNNNELINYIIKLIKNIIMKNKYKGKFDINDVIEYININTAQDISFEDIANKFDISASHLTRLLKRSLGMSYQEYLNTNRIKKAKNFLNNTSMSLDAISKECGFNSRFTFIRMFKKLEKINPSQYRMIEKIH